MRRATFQKLAVWLAVFLFIQVIPVVGVADPGDAVSYTYDFTDPGTGEWESGWEHLTEHGSVSVTLNNDQGSAHSSSDGWAVALRPELIADSVQEVTIDWTSQIKRWWGLVMRHDGGPGTSGSYYLCEIDNHKSDTLTIQRVTNGYSDDLGEYEIGSISTDQLLKCETSGSTIRAKIWDIGNSEPGIWHLEVSDNTFDVGRAGIFLNFSGNRRVSVDDYSLTGTESTPSNPSTPGGGSTYAESFDGTDGDPWPSAWTQLTTAPGTDPFLAGSAGWFKASGDDAISLVGGVVGDSEQSLLAIWDSEIRRRWSLAIRHDGGSPGFENGYYCRLKNDDGPPWKPVLQIVRADIGSITVLAEDASVSVDTNQWLSCVAEGSALKAKVWDQGSDEPAGWTLETTDGTYSSGRSGVSLGGSSNRRVVIDSYRLGPWPRTALQNPALSRSIESDRASADPLDGSTLSGDAFVFLTQDNDTTQAEFWIDNPSMTGTPDHVDTTAPFDLVGGEPSAADPWDTTALTEGPHTVTVRATLSDSSAVTLERSVVVDNLPDSQLVFSGSSDRTSPDALENASLIGDVFVFLDPDDPRITEVRFWIDDPLMTGPGDRIDISAPWDLVGGDSSAADPFDSTSLTDGAHTLTALVELADSSEFTLQADFTVNNAPGPVLTDLVLSLSPDRSSPFVVDSSIAGNDVYVFLDHSGAGIVDVSWWIDDPAMAGAAYRIDDVAPWDLEGDDGTGALAFDLNSLSDGEHQLTALVDLGSSQTVLTATLTVDNDGGLSLFSDAVESLGFDGYGAWNGGINAGLGSFVTSTTDLLVATAGPALTVERTYNSFDPYEGPFGRGWTFNWDWTWQTDDDGNVAVLFPDGRRELHEVQGDGSYLPPQGYYSDLASDGSDGFVLTLKDGTSYMLGSDHLLQSVTDANGRTVSLVYSGDELATVTDDASGRALTFTWANDRIVSAQTDSVTAHQGPLVWQYYYDPVGLLIQACDPRDNTQTTGVCTSYQYYEEVGGGLSSALVFMTQPLIHKITKPGWNTQVQLQYDANGQVISRWDGEGNRWSFDRSIDFEVTTTDPRLNTTRQVYDSDFRLVDEFDAGGSQTHYEYDASGNRSLIVDGNGNQSSLTYDVRGNLISQTNGELESTYFAYDAADNLIESRDGRSASSSDNTYLTTFTYDSARNRLSETDPLGNKKTSEYSDGTETAIGGGTIPAGLITKEVSARGNAPGASPDDFATVYEYDSEGDLRQITNPSGLVTSFDHDELGRPKSRTVVDSTAGTTATNTYAYDEAGNRLTDTGPFVTDVLSGESHQLRIINVYDDNSNLTATTLEDLAGDDPNRVTSFGYDSNDRETSVVDPESGSLSRAFDGSGNVIRVSDQESRIVETSYDARNLATTVTVKDFVDDPVGGSSARDLAVSQMTYDGAGRLLTETDAEGRVTRYTYDDADRVTLVVRVGHVDEDSTVRDVVLSSRVYDDAGNLVSETVGDGAANALTSTYSFDSAGRPTGSIVDPAGLDRSTTLTLDPNGNPTLIAVSESARVESTATVYDFADRVTSVAVENGVDDLTTTFSYDDRGNQISVVDGRGNAAGGVPGDYTTSSTYDILNRVVTVVSPSVDIDGGPTTTNPKAEFGYDTFGNRTHREDANGNQTISILDKLDRLIEIDHPAYTPPSGGPTLNPVELFAYDDVGNLVQRTSRRGFVTDFVFDDLNRVVAQTDPLIAGESSRGVIRFEYDDVGNRTAVVDQRGARTERTHDSLNRLRSETVIVRDPGGDILSVSRFDHDDLGNQTSAIDPVGGVVSSTFNPASELVSAADQLGDSTTFAWLLGRQVRATDPLGRYVESDHDLAGRLTESLVYDAGDTLLTTARYGYDEVGNRTTMVSPRGFDTGADPTDFTATYTFDAVNRLVGASTPVDAVETIGVSYGYDLVGNLTVFSDGEANTTKYSFNPWNLAESVVEPSTVAYPGLSDRTWTTSYDAGGLPVHEDLPGGVTVDRSYDELGRMTSESGAGDGTASRTVSYDLAGLLTGVDHPSGTIGYVFDDRGSLTDVSGPAGTASYTYDTVGRLTERTDTAGTASFSWTVRHQLDTLTDPITGTTLDYTWDTASQLTTVDYGTAGASRSYAYDGQRRLVNDTLVDAAATTVSAVVYGYDSDSNLTSKNITLSGNGDAGLHTYTYDFGGRLDGWTDPSSATTGYDWDKTGNRTTAGTDSFVFDGRNRLTSGPDGDYTYTPRGTLTTIDTTRIYDFDPLGRLTNAEGVSYSYDGLGRIATRDVDSFTYNGLGLDPTSDGNQTFSRSPGGRLTAVSDGTTDLLTGVDRHGDLTHLHTAAGVVTDTRLYDPFGDPLASTGTFDPVVGFQGDWTDPTTTHVWQGARWYQPTTATFLSRDTVMGELSTPMSLNRYTYGFASPLNYWDPDGRFSIRANNPLIQTAQAAQASMGWSKRQMDHFLNINTNLGPANTQPAVASTRKTPATNSTATADTILVSTSRQRAADQAQNRVTAAMTDYLSDHGAVPSGWDQASFRDQSNTFAWTMLRNTGRTSLSSSEFGALDDQAWLGLWEAQSDAAFQDVYQRQCNLICRNKTAINTAIIATAAGFLTGGAAATLAPATWGAVTTGAAAGGAGGLGSSLTSQTITGGYSLQQTLLETGLGAAGGAIAGKITGAIGQAAKGSLADDILPKPVVSDTKLQNIVDDLYRGNTNPGRTGAGTTADALRYELNTGQHVFGKSHFQKAQDSLRGLENWLKASPNAPYNDRLVGRSLADELIDALGQSG